MLAKAAQAGRDYFTLIAVQAFSLPLSVAYVSIVARWLGPQGWGELSLAMAVIQLFFSLGISWHAAAVVRFGKEEYRDHFSVGRTFIARGTLLLISLAIAFVFLQWLGVKGGRFASTVRDYAGLMFFLLCGLAISDHLGWLLKAADRMQAFAHTLLIRQVFLVGAVALLAKAYLTVPAVLVVESCGYIAVIVYAMIRLRSLVRLREPPEQSRVRDILKYSWPLLIAYACGYLSNWMDVYFIHYFLNTREIGIYQSAYRIVDYVRTPLYGICTVAFPVLMAVRLQEKRSLIDFYVRKITPQVTFIVNLAMLAVMAVSPYLIPALFGKEFSAAALPCAVLLAGVGFQVIAIMYTTIYSVYDWLPYNSAVLILVCIINGIGDILLIPRMGIMGAAVATALSFAAGSVGYLVIANRLLAIKTVKALCMVIPTFICAIGILMGGSYFSKVVAWGGALLLSFGLARFLRIFEKKDLQIWEKISLPLGIKQLFRWIYTGFTMGV